MELPFDLRKLPPGALDIIRFLGTVEGYTSDNFTIMDNTGLTDRGFGKSIRRLVTTGYAVMDASGVYRLTEKGQEAVEDLRVYDGAAPAEEDEPEIETINRRLVMVCPRELVAGQPAPVVAGFHPQTSQTAPVELVARLSMVNGEPEQPQEAVFQLASGADYHAFEVTPGHYTRARLRLEVYQLGPNPGDIAVAGGMYVDVNVTGSADGNTARVAYGADIAIEHRE